MKRSFLMLTIPLLLLLSCEKENTEDEVYEDFQSSTLLRQIGETEEDMQIFTYYNTGKIFEREIKFIIRAINIPVGFSV